MNWIHVLITDDDLQSDNIMLTGAKYHHLVRVRRVRVGARLRASIPPGRLLLAEVTEITDDRLMAHVTAEEPASGVSRCRIVLYQSVLKGEKMDHVVQKATELGVDTLAPVMARRSVPQWKPAQAVERAERWQRIAEAAAEQSERSVPMQIELPCTLHTALARTDTPRFVLHEREGRPLPDIVADYPSLQTVGLFIGPEGGWSDDEVDTLFAAAVKPIHLGGRILRAETAAIVAVTLAQYLWGDLGIVPTQI